MEIEEARKACPSVGQHDPTAQECKACAAEASPLCRLCASITGNKPPPTKAVRKQTHNQVLVAAMRKTGKFTPKELIIALRAGCPKTSAASANCEVYSILKLLTLLDLVVREGHSYTLRETASL
jgi:hypothetical protein